MEAILTKYHSWADLQEQECGKLAGQHLHPQLQCITLFTPRFHPQSSMRHHLSFIMGLPLLLGGSRH